MAGLITNIVVAHQSETTYTINDFHPNVDANDQVQWTAPEDSAITLLFESTALFGTLSLTIEPGGMEPLFLLSDASKEPHTYHIYCHRVQDMVKNGGDPQIIIV